MLKRIIGGTLAAALAGTIGFAAFLASAGAATTGTTSYVKNPALNYQFMSYSTNVYGGDNVIRNTPFGPGGVFSDAYQTLGADGVNLSATSADVKGHYADSGVVVPLGRLDSLFSADGKYVPPVIVGSNLEGYNLYFDTSGSGTYLGYPGGSAAYVDLGCNGKSPNGGYDGTNKASMGLVNNTKDNADFAVWGNEGGGISCQTNTAIPDASLTSTGISMEQVKLDFQNNTTGDTNPLVWAWIGVGDSASQTGYVTSVDGHALTVAPPAAASKLVAQDTCGNYANRHWTIYNVAGTRGRVAYVATRLNSGRWYYDGKHFVPAGKSVSFVTHRGGLLHVHYVAAPGVWGNGLFASHVSAC